MIITTICLTTLSGFQVQVASSITNDNPFKKDNSNNIVVDKDPNEPPRLEDSLCLDSEVDPWYEILKTKGSNAPPPLSGLDENVDEGCHTVKGKIYHKFVDFPSGFQIQYPDRTNIEIENTTNGVDFYFNTPTDQFIAIFVEHLKPTRGLPDYCFNTQTSTDIYSASLRCQAPFVNDLKNYAKSYFGLTGMDSNIVDHSYLTGNPNSPLFPVELKNGIYAGDYIVNSTATYLGELPALEVLIESGENIIQKHFMIRDQLHGYTVIDPYHGEEKEDILRMLNSFELVDSQALPRLQPSVEIDTTGLKIRILVTFPESIQSQVDTENLSVYVAENLLEIVSPFLSEPLIIEIPVEAKISSIKNALMDGMLEVSFDKMNYK